MEVTIGKSAEFIERAQAIRYQVFTVEQNIPNELDDDGLDSVAVHALVIEANQCVATARLVVKTNGSSVMARVAVLKAYRGRGIASIVVNKLIEYAKAQGVSSIEIHAHSYLRSYYEKLGFDFIQEVEMVGEHQLIEMRNQLVRT
ncbi:GNAT family N-acetyltransferase [Vibrio sp. RM-44-3]|uniref:GNAT family N-acetyltransferase n=1 Tax=unclassified Vibrio TaxID=2614977 RepID=UPI00215CFEA0|nr:MULTISPECIES: GNAT family N-acetyltransferase [unclassified Vibrio]MCR9549834.1 GNAT family N-acetyltransferase [Vibrio sp. RM-41-2A]MCR9554464.1 GNAT family N-acetyltransferase [Vibrio sp. RM-41-2B]MCR9621116.1 GNAT family N-acetyltransferase [Vibrio sp. RM-44-3]